MKFKLNTKPLQDALDLVVIQSNISKFYAKSTILQISVDDTKQLTLNTEADCVISEAKLKGAVENQQDITLFVDAILFKQLLSTIDTTTVDLEFDENSIVIFAGKSKYSVPNLLSADMSLQIPKSAAGEKCKLKQDVWKQVKSKQMYTLSDNFVNLVYTYIYNGQNEIIVGDYNNGLFTHSDKIGLPTTCLLSSNIVSILLNVNEKSELYCVDDSFVVINITDTYSFRSEFKPKYESDPETGSYKSEFIIDLLNTAEDAGIGAPLGKIKTILSQANLLASGDSPTVTWSHNNSKIRIFSDNIDAAVDGKLTAKSQDVSDFELKFSLKSISSVISNLEGENVYIYPSFRDGSPLGCVFKDDTVSVILAGVSDD